MDEILNTAKQILSTVAPTVATALGGPLGGLAIQSLINVLGLAPDTPQEEVYKNIISADADTLFKLKELETNFKLQMKKLDVDILSLENADRDSARKREMALNDNTNKYLAYAIIALYIIIQLWFVMSSTPVPMEMREIVMRSLGTLDTIIAMIFGYYYGSSSGSAMKSKMMEYKEGK